MIITFCGHSDYQRRIEDEQRIYAFLEETVGEEPLELYLGGYGAFDAFALRCGETYQRLHSNVKLIWVTPYLDPKHRNNLDIEMQRYDEILYPGLEHVPQKFAISHRNRWMVEQADAVIAFVSHEWGGAHQMLSYAKRKGKCILNLAQ